MSSTSAIEWTESTWSPITGCTKVSQGCKHCYAEREVETRWSKNPKSVWFGRKFTDIQCHPDKLDQPLHWREPRRIFVCPRADLFHVAVPDEYIAEVFAYMAYARQHTFQVLTKRADRMQKLLTSDAFMEEYDSACSLAHAEACDILGRRGEFDPNERRRDDIRAFNPQLPLRNVWLGISAEDQTTADERIPLLLRTPAAVRWISAEPLLGSIDLTRINFQEDAGDDIGGWKELGFDAVAQWENVLTGEGFSAQRSGDSLESTEKGWTEDARINWVVAGGESGPDADASHPEWFRSLRDQCTAAGVPFFFKQWGEWGPTGNPPVMLHDPGTVQMQFFGKKRAGRLLDGREHNDYPASPLTITKEPQ